jgi:hypothetical protein
MKPNLVSKLRKWWLDRKYGPSYRPPGAQRPLTVGLASPIHVATMRDMNDSHDDQLVEDFVHDPEFPAAGRVPAPELIPQWLTDSVGILGEWAANELPTCDSNRFGEALSQRILCGSGQLDSIGHLGRRPTARISSVTSSRE